MPNFTVDLSQWNPAADGKMRGKDKAGAFSAEPEPPAVTVPVWGLVSIPDRSIGVGQAMGISLGTYISDNGGDANITFGISSGTLPTGISLNPNGTFTGTATTEAAGVNIVYTATNSAGVAVPNAGHTVTVGTAPDWQLPITNFVSAKMPLQIVAPRPDAELTSASIYKYARPGMQYRLPVRCQGGAYPFYYEILATSGTSPSVVNATIGSFLTLDVATGTFIRGENYGVIQWTPGAGEQGSTFSITVRVTDQNGVQASVVINGTVDENQYVEMTPASDWNTVFGSTSSSVTNAGKIVVLRDGNYSLTANSDLTRIREYGGNHPSSMIAYPSELPIVSLTNARWRTESGAVDLFVGEIEWKENSQLDATGRMFLPLGTTHRNITWGNTFRDYFIGANPSSNNPAVIYYDGTDRNHQVVCDNKLVGSQGTFLQVYQWLDSVVENNSWNGANINQGDPSSWGVVYLKDDPTRVSVRANDWSGATFAESVSLQSCIAIGGQDGYKDVEICYNKAKHPATSGRLGALLNYTSTTAAIATDVFIYRNSISQRFHQDVGTYPTYQYIGKNIVETGTVPAGYDLDDNADGLVAPFDVNMNLTGEARTLYLGTHGAEISGE